MTGFELWLVANGWVKYAGEDKPFSSYDNCSRSYNKDDCYITVGLATLPYSQNKPGAVGIRVITRTNVYSLPTEDQYDTTIDQVYRDNQCKKVASARVRHLV